MSEGSEHIQVPRHRPALSAADLVTLNEEIAGMARAGLPLDQGLAAPRDMGRGRLQKATAALAQDLQAGYPLPEAMERQAGRVPPFYAGLLAAGIRSGRVADVLATLTGYARSLSDLRSLVIGALFYPLVVIALTVALFTLVSVVVMPQFEQMLKENKIPLPAVTRWALTISRHPLVYVVAALAALVLAVLVFRWWLRISEAGRRSWAPLVYAVPVVGTLIRAARLTAFTDLLAILADQDIPLPEAFRLAGDASSDPVTVAAARDVQADLNRGLPLAEALRVRRLVPELIVWMTGYGLRHGTLGKTLHQVADIYRRQVEMRANLLRSVLPPLLILIASAVLFGLFVLAIFLPMMELLKIGAK